MEVTIEKALLKEKEIVISLFNYYLYEFSDLMGSELNENGTYLRNTSLIAPYWEKPNHIPYFIKVNGEIAGFIFVRYFPDEEKLLDIDQFFILRKFKRRGVGSKAFELCLKAHNGNWLVRVLKENESGLSFWQSVIGSVTKNNFKHAFEFDRETEMHFFRFSYGS